MPPYHFSKIKDLYVQLAEGYKFHHGVNDEKDNNNRFFIGREHEIDRLKLLIEKSELPSGAYLISGYRGMGKTSLVDKVVGDLNKDKKKKYQQIKISLSQDEVNDLDILRPIAHQLYLHWEQRHYQLFGKIYSFLGKIVFLLFIPFLLYGLFFYWRREAAESFVSFFTYYLAAWKVIRVGVVFILISAFVLLLHFWLLERHRNILNKLAILDARLHATLQENVENSLKFGRKISILSSTIARRTQKNYPVASTKEIERELIDILNAINKYRKKANQFIQNIGRKWLVPHYIVVIDELDKIEPNYIFNPDSGETAQKLLSADFNVFGGNKIKKRQIAVARILANLKSFLSMAQAKFIFIGGREMYDAFLADIADRDSFYSSIFNDVIYVDSFFKDKIVEEGGGISKMTELYLCQLLMGVSADKKSYPNLGDYLNKLLEIKGGQSGGSPSDLPDELAKLEIYKTIFLLQNFIIFLTYRSNGSPKKLAELISKYVVRESSFMPEKDDSIVVEYPGETGEKEERLFLYFSFKNQYEIGLTSSLYRPYVIIHSRHLKLLGDKLLYSTAYILDYILKFHQQGFSWRSLELIPDIILINKDPNLRFFLEDLMRFLSNMHVRETISGAFQFKFYSKVSSELRLISKISESSSAAFNFGLDESFQIKSYYKSKLQEVQQSYKSFYPLSNDDAFIHSVSFIQTILGDLHYYDKEYDDAIMYYSDSVQAIRNTKDPKKITNHQAVLFVRNMLKLGLSLEKIRAYDSAYSIYRSLILKVPQIVGPALEEPGENSWEAPYTRMQLFAKPFIALLGLIEKQRMDGITYANLRRNREELDEFLESQALDYFEKEGDLNSPFRAATQKEGLEQENEIGQKTDNDSQSQQNANKKIKEKDWRRLWALNFDYFNSIGGFLFYKNRNFQKLFESEAKAGTPPGFSSFIFGKYSKMNLNEFKSFLNQPLHAGVINQAEASNNPSSQDASHGSDGKNPPCDYTPSISAYIYYRWALRDLLKIYKDHVEMLNPGGQLDDFCVILNLLRPEFTGLINSTNLYMFANLFTKLGDTVLCMVSKHGIRPIEQEVFDIFVANDSVAFSIDKEDGVFNMLKKWLEKLDMQENPYDINLALVLYRISGLFYARANRNWSFAFQFKKFLFIVKDYIAFLGRENHTGEPAPGPTMQVVENIAQKIFQAITWTGGVSNRPQIIKYRQIFNHSYLSIIQATNKSDRDTYLLYNNLSTNAEIREVVVLVEGIRLKLFQVETPSSLVSAPKPLLTPYDTISSMYTRILELKYRSEYNYWLLSDKMDQNLLFQDYRDSPSKMKEHAKSIFENLDTIEVKLNEEGVEKMKGIMDIITDSVFCLSEVVRLLNLYGISYTFNHSFLANAHYKLANWCNAYWNIEAIEEEVKIERLQENSIPRIRTQIQKMLGIDSYNYLEPNYHNEMALQQYYSAIQMHLEGKAYREQLHSLSFLEDDFNDNLTHFSAASERLRVNTGKIRERIGRLKEKVQSSRLYQYSYFVPPVEDPEL